MLRALVNSPKLFVIGMGLGVMALLVYVVLGYQRTQAFTPEIIDAYEPRWRQARSAPAGPPSRAGKILIITSAEGQVYSAGGGQRLALHPLWSQVAPAARANRPEEVRTLACVERVALGEKAVANRLRLVDVDGTLRGGQDGLSDDQLLATLASLSETAGTGPATPP